MRRLVLLMTPPPNFYWLEKALFYRVLTELHDTLKRAGCKVPTKRFCSCEEVKAGGGAQVSLLKDSVLEIEFVPVTQNIHNRNTNQQWQPSTHSHTTTNFSLALSTLYSSTSWRAPDEKPARHPENLFLLTQRHATYFPRQRSTSLPHYFFSPRTLWFNLASRLVAVWTPAALHSCCGMYQISQAHQCNTHRHTQTHSTCSCQRPFQAESVNICLETSGLACSAWGEAI